MKNLCPVCDSEYKCLDCQSQETYKYMQPAVEPKQEEKINIASGEDCYAT